MTNAIQIIADQIPDVAPSTANPFASACRNTKETRHSLLVNFPKIPVIRLLAVPTPNAPFLATASPSALVYQATLKAPTPSEAVWSKGARVSLIHVASEPNATPTTNLFASVRTPLLAIRTEVATLHKITK